MKSKWDRPILAVAFVLSGFLVGAVSGTEADAQTWTILTAIGTIATAVVAVWISISQEKRIDERIQAENLQQQKDTCLTVLYTFQQMERIAQLVAIENVTFRSVKEVRKRMDLLWNEWMWVIQSPGHSALVNFLASQKYPCNGREANVLDESNLALQGMKTIADDAADNVLLGTEGFQSRAEKLSTVITIAALLCHRYYNWLSNREDVEPGAVPDCIKENVESELEKAVLCNEKLSQKIRI